MRVSAGSSGKIGGIKETRARRLGAGRRMTPRWSRFNLACRRI
jgi:hypothetical protein